MLKKYDVTAIIYDKRGHVLSIGRNSYVKTHPLQVKYALKFGEVHKVFLHAEIHAITKCRNLDKAHKMVVIRYLRDGSTGPAKPCKICQAAIKQSGIKFIEHT